MELGITLPHAVSFLIPTQPGTGNRNNLSTRPHSPHGVHVRGGQAGAADRGAVVRPHDPLGQEEVAEQTGHQQVLPEQLLEKVCKDRTSYQRRNMVTEDFR